MDLQYHRMIKVHHRLVSVCLLPQQCNPGAPLSDSFSAPCLCGWGRKARITKETWMTSGGEYLRGGPNRLVFPVLLNALIVRNPDKAKHGFIQSSALLKTKSVWVTGGQVTAASLMSHCLASTNVPAAGANLFTERKLQLFAGTDSCVPGLQSPWAKQPSLEEPYHPLTERSSQCRRCYFIWFGTSNSKYLELKSQPLGKS
jgi:hypothetical protein